ncbi:MAG: rod shape-determining protein MreD [Clostridiales bacterium]|nr:rod shape-determining protein MreD [Clostridiales bacterium]
MHSYGLKHILFFLLFLIFHPFLSKWFGINGFSPDFLLVAVMIATFNKNKKQTLIVAILFGFLCDLLYAHVFFQYSVIFLLVTVSVWGINKLAKRENILYLSIFGFISGYIFSLIKAFYELPISEITTTFNVINRASLINGGYYFVTLMLISLFYLMKSIFTVSKVSNNVGGVR